MTLELREVECLWHAETLVGESPLWVEREAALYFLDIYRDRLYRYQPNTGDRRSWAAPPRLSALVPIRAGGFLASARHCIGALHVDESSAECRFEPWLTLSSEPETNRLNDGKCDAHGRYFTGTMDENKAAASGSLFLMDSTRQLTAVDRGYTISNGPTFSVDGRRMYHADTSRQVVYCFDLSLEGGLSNKREFLRFSDADGRPDGMTTDAEGGIWIAHSGGGKVTRFSEQGAVDRVVRLPVSKITSLAFGGPDYRTLFITTARKGLDDATLVKEPLSGALFAADPKVQGLPAQPFVG